MNPIDLTGPQFLRFYATLFLIVVAAAILLRWYLRRPGGEPPAQAFALTPAEVAYLGGGEERLVYATVARLVRDDALAFDAENRMLTAQGEEPPEGASKLERAVFSGIKKDPKVTLSALSSVASWTLEPIRRRLHDLGLLLTEPRADTTRLLPLFLVLLVPLLGVIKIFVGIARDRPVLYLVAFCVVSVAVAAFVFGRSVHRSRRGDRALARLRADNAAVEYQAARRANSLSGDDLVLALGLFGMGALAGSPLARLGTALAPPPLPSGMSDRTSSKCASCGSSWSSCGSGSSCGGSSCGGGCGGGGCGGCGS